LEFSLESADTDESAAVKLDALFARDGARRVVAAVDDHDMEAMRLIETLGFRFEGAARAARSVGDEWVDEARFALLAEERSAWVSRVRTPATTIELVELTHETAGPYAALSTHRFQQEFVAPMALSFRHALLPEEVNGARVVPWFRGIAADGVPVGFVMLAVATADFPEPYLWRLLIDRWHQRRCIGQCVIAMLSEVLRAEGHERLVTSWGLGVGSPEPFYRGLGFKPTGELVDGHEIEAALNL